MAKNKDLKLELVNELAFLAWITTKSLGLSS